MTRIDLTDVLAGKLVSYLDRARELGLADNGFLSHRTIPWFEREFGFKLIKRVGTMEIAQLEFDSEEAVTLFLLKI